MLGHGMLGHGRGAGLGRRDRSCLVARQRSSGAEEDRLKLGSCSLSFSLPVVAGQNV